MNIILGLIRIHLQYMVMAIMIRQVVSGKQVHGKIETKRGLIFTFASIMLATIERAYCGC